jgi:hypothetical protein
VRELFLPNPADHGLPALLARLHRQPRDAGRCALVPTRLHGDLRPHPRRLRRRCRRQTLPEHRGDYHFKRLLLLETTTGAEEWWDFE